MGAEDSKEKNQSGAPKAPPGRLAFKKMTGDLIGVGVLAIGVAAFLGVGYLAFAKWGKGPEDVAANEASADEAAPVCVNCGSGKLLKPAQPLPSKGRLARPKEGDLAGSWQADFGVSKAFIQISKGAFELIYTDDPRGRNRRYSRGRYDYDPKTGVLILKPKGDLGKPSGAGIIYNILTMRQYGVDVFKDKRSGALYWKPAAIEDHNDQTHPLFLYTNRKEATIEWQKVR